MSENVKEASLDSGGSVESTGLGGGGTPPALPPGHCPTLSLRRLTLRCSSVLGHITSVSVPGVTWPFPVCLSLCLFL